MRVDLRTGLSDASRRGMPRAAAVPLVPGASACLGAGFTSVASYVAAFSTTTSCSAASCHLLRNRPCLGLDGRPVMASDCQLLTTRGPQNDEAFSGTMSPWRMQCRLLPEPRHRSLGPAFGPQLRGSRLRAKPPAVRARMGVTQAVRSIDARYCSTTRFTPPRAFVCTRGHAAERRSCPQLWATPALGRCRHIFVTL